MVIEPRIFVSYSHQNDNAKLFISLFEKHIQWHNAVHPHSPQFEVWTDKKLTAGDHWTDKIDEAIDTSFALVVAVTPEAVASHYVTYEWAYAIGRKCFVIPLLIDEVSEDQFHKKIQDIQWDEFWKARDHVRAVEDLFDILAAKYSELRHQDRLEVAKEVAQRILSYLNIGRKQRESGDFNNAMTSFGSAEADIVNFNKQFPAPQVKQPELTEVDKLEDDVYYEIALIHYLKEERDNAEKYYQKAIEKNPSHVHSIVGLGVLNRIKADEADLAQETSQKGHYLMQAHTFFHNALTLQPDIRDTNDESVWASLGGICKRMKRQTEAIQYYLEATKYKKSAYPYINLGLLHMELQQRDQMIANFRVALYFAKAKLRVTPGDRWAHNDELVSQLVLNACSDNPEEQLSDDQVRQIIDRVIIVVDGNPLERLHSVIKHDLLSQQPSVVDTDIVSKLLKRIEDKDQGLGTATTS